MKRVIVSLMIAGFIFAADNLEKQARDAVNKAVKDKTIAASDMSKYIEKINKGKAADVLKELGGSGSGESTPSGAGAAATAGWPKGKVVGWRTDGTGRYPKENPPTEWSRSEDGKKKNILWETKLPCYTWSTPIIVGDKLITLSDPYDIICMDKNTGKLLWIRSYPPFVALPEEDKANPGYKEVAGLVEELQKINNEFVKSGWTKEIYKKKYDIQKQINAKTAAIDGKYNLPKDQYVESWTGYTALTPCSDGQYIYFDSGDGVTGCYDLDGNLKWTKYESLAAVWGEHGFPNSGTVVGDVFMSPTGSGLRGFDKTTGKELWKAGAGGWMTLPLKVGGVDYVVAGGSYIRVKDGKMVVPHAGDMPGGMMVINDNIVYFVDSKASFSKVESKGDGLSITPLIAEEYNRLSLPTGDNPVLKVDPSITGFVSASPLYDNGLLYSLGAFGKFIVIDTKKTKNADAIVYSNLPPFDFKNHYSRKTFGMGIGLSPILAGKYIYLTDSSGCTLVIEPGRTYKQIAKNSIDYTMPEAWETNYWMGPYHEQFEASPIVDSNRIYLRGEQYMYCVGEK